MSSSIDATSRDRASLSCSRENISQILRSIFRLPLRGTRRQVMVQRSAQTGVSFSPWDF